MMDVEELSDNDWDLYKTETHLKEAPEHQRPPSELSHHRSSSGSRPTSSLSRVSSPSASFQQYRHGSNPYTQHAPRPSNTQGTAWTHGSFPFPMAQPPRRSTPNSDYSNPELSGYSPSPSRLNSPSIPSSPRNSARQLSSGSAYAALRQELAEMLIDELLWVPSIRELNHSYQDLKNQIVNMSSSMSTAMEMQTQMYNDISSLRKRLEQQ